MARSKNVLVTGANSGFGAAIMQAALAAGHVAIGTVRRESDRAVIESWHPERAMAALLDVTDFDAVDRVVSGILSDHGPIDVLVNSAGYGHEGIVEESPLHELRRQFDVNLIGAVAMIKAVLPTMRERRLGHIINITSMAGYVGLAGIGYYAASKFALEGISESLALELAPLGIKVTALAPGSFRTDWAGRSMVRSPRSIAAYDGVMDPIRRARRDKSGKQRGDPKRAAALLIELLEMSDPPTKLLIGGDAIDLVVGARTEEERRLTAWNEISRATDFP